MKSLADLLDQCTKQVANLDQVGGIQKSPCRMITLKALTKLLAADGPYLRNLLRQHPVLKFRDAKTIFVGESGNAKTLKEVLLAEGFPDLLRKFPGAQCDPGRPAGPR